MPEKRIYPQGEEPLQWDEGHPNVNQMDALRGTESIPSDTNRYVTSLDPRLIFGTEYFYAESLGTSSTISTSYITKITLITPSLPSGNYRVSYSSEGNHSNVTASVNTRLLQNGTTQLYETITEPKNTTDFLAISGFINISLSGVHTFELQFKRTGAVGTASIRNAKIEIFKIS